ncbi:uncharacterized protein [Rutidosis leptorrhynchoides]|uniref:uncharacterized protein n=1 Tax=Rutidosis leptorrhynchoides TaxID=125765 RepID=UPI003A98DC18
MAIDLYSENSNTGNNITMSPRISFSHDLSNTDTVPVEQFLRSISSSSSTVDFNFCVQQNLDHHHADELFSNGKMIPIQIKEQPPPQPSLPTQSSPKEQHNMSKSFWGFKRSSSCGNGYARSLCPIPLMSRSNSTGSSTSTTNSKRSSKEGFTQKHHNYQKPPLRKANYGYGNGNSNSNNNTVRVNPVLNLGFGSLFSIGKKK